MTRQVLFQRVAYGILALAFLCALFLLDILIARWAAPSTGALAELLRRGSVVPLTTILVFVLGARELDKLLRARGARPFTWLSYLTVALLIAAPWLASAAWVGSSAAQLEGLQPLRLCLLAGVLAIACAAVLRGETTGALQDVGASWLIIIYLGFLGSFATQLHCDRDLPAHAGGWLLLIAALITKSSDIGAFLIGSAIGRHRLIPKVSPGKSIEGTIAGIAFSAGVAVLLIVGGAAWLLPDAAADDRAQSWGVQAALLTLTRNDGLFTPWIRAALLGAALSIAGQFGDLLESCFKRDADVKDSGNILPRFGGILDLIDSLIPAVPVAWFLFTVVWGVV